MGFLDTTTEPFQFPDEPFQVPPEATQHVIDTYSVSVFKSIFTKIIGVIKTSEPSAGDILILPKFDEHEILFMKKYCSAQTNEILVETPKECIIGNGEKQLKVKLDVLHKMKERKLMTEVVNSSKEELPSPPPGGSDTATGVRNVVNKNAYEIRLDVLKESIPFSKGDPDRAIKIADLFYRFVENKRRM